MDDQEPSYGHRPRLAQGHPRVDAATSLPSGTSDDASTYVPASPGATEMTTWPRLWPFSTYRWASTICSSG